jgi:hypothetical protein
MPAETMITILAVTLMATAWALWLLPVGTCSECPHCRISRLAQEREADDAVGRLYGIPLCQSCGRHHPKGDPHRT